MERRIRDQHIAMVLDKVWNQYSENIKLEAIVSMAMAEQSTQETINKKVNNKLAAINAEIAMINPKYNENSKKYDITKAEILDVLTNYEEALKNFSKSYDEEIQKLILAKVELEAIKLGLLIKDEYLEERTEIRTDVKKSISEKVSNTLKNIMFKIAGKDKKEQFDVTNYYNVADAIELEKHVKNKVDEKLEKTKESAKANDKYKLEIDEKIKEIEKLIEDKNQEKVQKIINCMESKEKWIAVDTRKPKIYSRAKTFILARINTPKMVHSKVIAPMNKLITEFKAENIELLEGKVLEIDSLKKEIRKIKQKIDKDYKEYRDSNLEKVKEAHANT